MTTATDLLSLSWHHIGDPSPYGSWEEAPALHDPRLVFSVFFWTETSDVMQSTGTTLPLPGWVTAPAASIITGTTLDFFFYFQSPCLCAPSFPVLLLLDESVYWDGYIYHNWSLLLLVNHDSVWLVGQQMLLCVELVVPQDVSLVLFNHLWSCLPFGLRVHMSTNVHYTGHLLVPFSACCTSLHLG